MKTLAAFLLVAAVGCTHDKKPVATEPTTPSSPVATSTGMSATPDTDPEVDPTLPSWAPRSCVRYHTAVVRYTGCETEAEGTRQSVRESYDADLKKWEAAHDLPQGAIDDIGKDCASKLEQVSAKTPSSCPTTRTTPIKSAKTDSTFPNS